MPFEQYANSIQEIAWKKTGDAITEEEGMHF